MSPMSRKMSRKLDLLLSVLFGALTIGFIFLMVFNQAFFDFAWGRHHNQLSWYIRPLMLLPFCYFAYHRSFAGMFFSVFALATSMMWFPEPAVVSAQAEDFLQMEVAYLSTDWTVAKVLMAALVPLMFVLLGMAFWRRQYFYGVLVIIFSSVTKMIWSVVEGGASGYVLFPAAIAGIVISVLVVYFGKARQWL